MKKMYLCLAGRLNSFIIVILLLLIFLGNGLCGYGQVYNWDGSTSDAWFNPSNWIGNASPSGINATVIFNNNAELIVGYNMNFATAMQKSIANISFGPNTTTSRTIKNSSTTVAGALILNTNPIITNSSSANHTITNGTGTEMTFGIQLGNVTNNVINTDGTGDITIGCVISGANPLTKSGIGNGVLNLSPANTYTGKTTISSSYINTTDESAFGANPAGFIADQITMNGGGIQATSGDINFSSNRGITLGVTGGNFDVATSRTITALNVITGSGTLNITSGGTGLVVMTGQHTYSGTTTATSGTLQLNRTGGNTIPGSNNVVINGGTLSITTNQTLNNLDINSGTLNISAGTTLTINGTLTYSGGTINTTGTIVYGPSGKLIYNASKTTGIEWSNSNLPNAVTLNNAAVVMLANNASTSGNLIINNTARVVGTAFNLTVSGDWNSVSTNGGVGAGYTGGISPASTVILNGSGLRSINHAGGAIFRNLNISGTGYYTANNSIEISVNTLNISNGTLDMSTNTLNGSGILSMSSGLLKLAKLNTTLPELTGTYSLLGGTIELYGGLGSQILRSGITSYRNLTFSGSSTTTLASNATTPVIGNVYITGNAIFDASNYTFGDGSTNLIMDAGRYRVSGVGSKPNINGSFTLTGGVMEYYNSNTVSNETIKGISSISNPIIFNQIEVTGNKVGQGASNITLGNAGSFSVKPSAIYEINDDAIVGPTGNQTVTVETGGTFKTGDVDGFAGGTVTSIKNDIENVVLQPGCTVEYSKATSIGQIITKNGVTNPSTGNYYNLTLSGNGTKTAPSSVLSILGNLIKSSTCFFAHNKGTVSIDGTSATTQTYTSTTPIMEFCKLTNNNTVGGFTVNGDLGVDSLLTLSGNSKLIFGSGTVNIRSGPLRTGAIGQITPNTAALINYTGSGRFQIERYLYQKKAWRLLATPVESGSSPSITESWRESGFNTSTGYGTQITGPSGMDTITQRGSMKWFDPSLNNYREITNTGSAIARREGYYVFVRGDRAQTPTGIGGETNLRIKGKILTGTQPDFDIAAGKFASVGNPYASAIDMRNVTKTGGIVDGFIAWNPNSALQLYGVGGFENYTYNISTNHYERTPIGLGITKDTIQSGEAIFFQTFGASGKIIFEENDKVNGSKVESRIVADNARTGILIPTLEMNLYSKNTDGSSLLADGIKMEFKSNYNNSLDNLDSRKINNSFENLAIKKSNYNIVVERRKILTSSDTIFLSLTNTRIAPYCFEIDPSVLTNLPLNAFLKDKFLGTETSVSLTSVTNVNFSITSDAASRVADRFMIVFKQAIPNGQFTGNFISIAVDKNADKTNALKWSYSNELNIAQYSIERSKNGTAFTGVGNQNAENVSSIKSYTFTDATNGSGTNYYRVKATSTTGQVQYSNTVKINEPNVNPVFAVWPNPIENKTMRISFENLEGAYSLKLVAKQGATVYSAQITVSSGKEVKNIAVGNGVAAGLYELVLINKAGKSLVQTVVVQ